MSEQKIQELFKRKEFIVGYKDFNENGIDQLDEKSEYHQIYLIHQFISLFQTKSIYESKTDLYAVLLNICSNFSKIEQRINNIQNKLMLAKIYDFKSFFVLCDKDTIRESIEAFKISANYFVDFILENEIHEHSCYDLITGLINLFKHKYFNQLKEPIISKLDDCISKLYTANKICYTHLNCYESFKDKEKIERLLSPILDNFDDIYIACNISFFLTLIKTYFKFFKGKLSIENLYKMKSKCGNNPDCYQALKTIASKLPNVTTGLIEFKADLEKDIAKYQKYWFNHTVNNSITIQSSEIQESINNIEKIYLEFQSTVNLDLSNKNSPIEKFYYLLYAFNDFLKKQHNTYFNSETQDFKMEILSDRNISDLLGFCNTWFKPDVIDKKLCGIEAKKQHVILGYFNILQNISVILFNSLHVEIEKDVQLKGYILGLINQNSFFEHRKEETLIAAKMFISNQPDLMYAAMFLLVPNLELCFQRNIDNIGVVSSTQKRSSGFSRHSRYMTDIVNNCDEMMQLGFKDYEICLLKTLFSNSSETQAGYNLRNDLMHGAIPLNNISLSFSKLLFFILLHISRKFLTDGK